MDTVVTTIISVVVSLAVSTALFVGFNKLIDQTGSRWPVFRAGLGLVIGLYVGAIIQHNAGPGGWDVSWLKLGGDLGGPLKDGWLTIFLCGALGAAFGFVVGSLRVPDLGARQRSEARWRPVAFVGPAIFFVGMGLILPSVRTMVLSLKEGQRGEGSFSLANYEAIFGDDDFFNMEGWQNIFTSRLMIVGIFAILASVALAWASTQDVLGGRGKGIGRSLRGVFLALVGLGALLALVGLFEGIARDPNRSWIYDNLLTPAVQSRVSLWIVVCGLALFLGFVGGQRHNDRDDAFVRALRSSARWFGIVAAAVVVLGVIELLVWERTEVEFSSDTLVAADLRGSDLWATIFSPTFLTLFVLAVALHLVGLWFGTQQPGGAVASTLDWGSPGASLFAVAAVIFLLLAVFSTMQSVLWNNLWWAVTVTGLCTVFGLSLAILADRAKGERFARTMIFLPMAISMVGAAVIWDFMYVRQPSGEEIGLINAILSWLGFQPRGFFINAEMIPWNNFWIMLILVWIQTGFSMVVLSSAIKGVPDELIEAARVDGAGEVQIFWRVIIPQIRSTIIVVITTLLIITMKIFDLVKATTGGSQRTNVLANEMFDQLRNRNFALSSAFAVTIFALTLPVMIYNVRKTQRELG